MVTTYDMCYMNASTTGTGTITLNAAIAGFQTFNGVVANNVIISYGINDAGSTWEVGQGTYTNTSGILSLTRGALWSSNSGGPINMTAAAQVYVTVIAEDLNTFVVTNSIAIGANITMNTTVMFIGNSTVNAVSNSTSDVFANSTANTQIGAGTLTLAGDGSNTGFTLGTASKAANGYTFLPNGLLLQWMQINANTTNTRFAFPVTFPTNVFCVTVEPSNTTYTSTKAQSMVIAANTSGANIVTGNSTATLCYVLTIGH